MCYKRYCLIRDHYNYKDADVSARSGIAKSTFSDWKSGRSAPREKKSIQIASALNVSLEFLKGEISFISCPFCNFEYNPLSECSSNDHDIFHDAFKKAKDKYPFLLTEKDAKSFFNEYNDRVVEGLSEEEKIEILEKKIIAQYSLDLKKQNYNLNGLGFDYYRLYKLASILSTIQNSYFFDLEFYSIESNLKQLIQEYLRDITTQMIENKQLLLLFCCITQLPKSTLDLLEIQIKALVDAKTQKSNLLPSERQFYSQDEDKYGMDVNNIKNSPLETIDDWFKKFTLLN